MFGGAGLKAGESNVAMFDRERLAPFTYERRKGERAVMSYRRMPDRLYDDPDELAVWARTALAAAQQPKPRKRSAAKKGKASRTKPARPKPKRPRPKRAEKTPAKTGRKRRP